MDDGDGSNHTPVTSQQAEIMSPLPHRSVVATAVLLVGLLAGAPLMAFGAPAAGDVSAAAAKRWPSFQTPSGNIHCIDERYEEFPRTLRCDINSGLNPEPSRDCEFDWGAMTLGKRRRGKPMCASDTGFNSESRVLAYGTTWKRGPFTCTSRRSGLTCRNEHDHGIFLSRSEWRRW